MGLPHSSFGKESACNAGDPGSIPGSGRSAGEGIGYTLQYPWASFVAQLVRNLPAVWENWVRSLGWEDPLEKGKATHSSILVCRIPCTVWSMGLQRVRHNQVTKHRTSRESIPYLPGCCLQSKPTNPQTEGQKVVEGLACDRPCLLLQGPPVSPAGSQDTQWLCLNEVLSE